MVRGLPWCGYQERQHWRRGGCPDITVKGPWAGVNSTHSRRRRNVYRELTVTCTCLLGATVNRHVYQPFYGSRRLLTVWDRHDSWKGTGSPWGGSSFVFPPPSPLLPCCWPYGDSETHSMAEEQGCGITLSLLQTCNDLGFLENIAGVNSGKIAYWHFILGPSGCVLISSQLCWSRL